MSLDKIHYLKTANKSRRNIVIVYICIKLNVNTVDSRYLDLAYLE